MRLMTKTLLFCMIMANVFAYDGDIEIVFDNGFDNESSNEMTIPINEFLEFANKDWRRKRVEKNLKEFMSLYFMPRDDELAKRIMFFGGAHKLGIQVSYFCPTAEERIDMLEYLVSEGRIIPDVLMSRLSGTQVFTLEVLEPSVYEWIISKCTGCLCPPPNNDDEKDDWCDMLWRMRSLCLRRDCFNAYVTLQKILLSDVITDDEKEAMKQLYEKRFGQNSMMIFFL